jgi:pyruvate-formate lyase-activating enzyme
MKESSHTRRSYGMTSQALTSVSNVRIIIKLTNDTTVCVHDQIWVDNMSCVAIGGETATVQDYVSQAFRLCKREKLNNIPATLTSRMEDLLKCPGKYVEESVQELD